MDNKRIPNLYLENAEILPGGFRNFAGRGGMYNKEGERNFNVVISDEKMAEKLIADGWNLRELKPRDNDDPDEPPRYKLNIKVDFEGHKKHPRIPETLIYLYSGKQKTLLTEETVGTLDYAEYSVADLTIRPRRWYDEKTGEWRVKAYLQEMRVTVEASRWEEKYADYGNDEEDDDGDLPF